MPNPYTPQAENLSVVEQAREACSCPGGQDAQPLLPTSRKFICCGTGILPVHVRAGKKPNPYSPQAENSLFVEQASCLFLENRAKCSIAHHRPSTFIYTKKFKIFDRTYCPKLDFRIELLSSVSFH
ncbi:hypothetical protein [Microcoleus sp. D2_18a_B4]|uniref:hypothetical protein n=1 Tax=Microcoleus sp. D2_18a_B4 TaxID=3055329 RepID=UPI002FCF99A2